MSEIEFATDDNTPYIASDNVDDVIKIFENDFNGFQITK